MDKPRILNGDLWQSLEECKKEKEDWMDASIQLFKFWGETESNVNRLEEKNKEIVKDIICLYEYLEHICDMEDVYIDKKFSKIYKKYQRLQD